MNSPCDVIKPYDGLGRLITAEKGTSSNGDAVASSAFTYDSFLGSMRSASRTPRAQARA